MELIFICTNVENIHGKLYIEAQEEDKTCFEV